MKEVLPEIVSEDDEGYKSVDYSKLTPLLIEAIKELKAENENLKAETLVLRAKHMNAIKAFKFENETLKQEIEQIKKAIGKIAVSLQ